MSKEYKHWFTLVIEHEYFINKICTVFNLLATDNTARIMKNYGIRFQKNKNKYEAFVEVSSNEKIWESLSNAEDLYFELINTDVNFNNYTDTDLSIKEDKLVYITNTKIVNRFNKNAVVKPNTELEVYPLRFNINVAKNKQTKIVIKSNNEEIFKSVSPEKQSIAFIDISIFGTGVYELWIDDVLVKKIIGCSKPFNNNCYGVLHINMRNVLESLKENTLPLINLSFGSRATYREYVVIVPNDKKIEIKNMEIDGVEDEVYNKPEKKMMFGNHDSDVFTSTKAIKLRQKVNTHSVLKIEYSHQFSDALSELEIKLPVPKVSSIINEKKNNENVYHSQSIIYV